MNQEIPWNRFAVEAFVIVSSILLAFSIDAWWDNRSRLNTERDYLTALVTEYDEGLRRSNAYLRILPERQVVMNVAVELIQERLQGKEVNLGATLSQIRAMPRPFEFERIAIDNLLGSGGYQLISDPVARQLITYIETRKAYFTTADLLRSDFYYDYFTGIAVDNRVKRNAESNQLVPISDSEIGLQRLSNILSVMIENNVNAVSTMNGVREAISQFLVYSESTFGITSTN
ncbi:MAG: hypothetical protein R3F50_11345 [Gammaproteobacteria bacterium]